MTYRLFWLCSVSRQAPPRRTQFRDRAVILTGAWHKSAYGGAGLVTFSDWLAR
jgi:hypothetical protein